MRRARAVIFSNICALITIMTDLLSRGARWRVAVIFVRLPLPRLARLARLRLAFCVLVPAIECPLDFFEWTALDHGAAPSQQVARTAWAERHRFEHKPMLLRSLA